MTGPGDPPRMFELLLVAKPDGPDPTPGIRHILKLALRRYGLRCVEARELINPPTNPERTRASCQQSKNELSSMQSEAKWPVKVGITANLLSRLRSLQNGSATKLDLVWVYTAYHREEALEMERAFLKSTPIKDWKENGSTSPPNLHPKVWKQVDIISVHFPGNFTSGATARMRHESINCHLRAAGLSAEQIVKVMEEADADRREKERIKKRNQRARPRDGGDTGTTGDRHIYFLLLEEKKKEKRKVSIAADWKPSAVDREYAKGKGWSDERIDREQSGFACII